MAVPRGFREEIESARLTLRALYRAVDFPLRWERHAVLVEGV